MEILKNKLVSKLIRELSTKLFKLEGIYLFGSRAQDEQKPSSDWDFAYLCREKNIDEIVWDIKLELETKFDMSLDMVNLYNANTILQIQVIKTGRLIWTGDTKRVKEFEYLTLSYYQKLNDERADILKDIKSRGSIYG